MTTRVNILAAVPATWTPKFTFEYICTGLGSYIATENLSILIREKNQHLLWFLFQTLNNLKLITWNRYSPLIWNTCWEGLTLPKWCPWFFYAIKKGPVVPSFSRIFQGLHMMLTCAIMFLKASHPHPQLSKSALKSCLSHSCIFSDYLWIFSGTWMKWWLQTVILISFDSLTWSYCITCCSLSSLSLSISLSLCVCFMWTIL